MTKQIICRELDTSIRVDFAEGLKKDSVVLLLEKYFLSSAAMVHDMIDSSRVLDTKRARDDNVNYQGKVLTVNKRFDPLGLISLFNTGSS